MITSNDSYYSIFEKYRERTATKAGEIHISYDSVLTTYASSRAVLVMTRTYDNIEGFVTET